MGQAPTQRAAHAAAKCETMQLLVFGGASTASLI